MDTAILHPINTGDTAWVMLSAILVLLMSLPGIGLFYSGMVRRKNVLTTLVQPFAVCGMISILWIFIGYSLTFSKSPDFLSPWIGGLGDIGLSNLLNHFNEAFTLGAGQAGAIQTQIPESVFVLFQMDFAIIAPALLVGALAGRARFSALCVFLILWSLFVYIPVAHWVWAPEGWIAKLGAIDYAGGTVVHVTSGISGLVAACLMGPRKGLGKEDFSPWNLSYTLMGAAFLTVGWFGFNAGSALGANGRAGMAMLATQSACASGALIWGILEWRTVGKPTALGIVSGALAGLVGITPAAGFVLPYAAILIGALTSLVCWWSVTRLKPVLGYDDSLDAFGIHGVGGILGGLLTGALACGKLTAMPEDPVGIWGSFSLVGKQAIASGAAIIWSVIVTYILYKIVDFFFKLRIDLQDEHLGMDITQHGERLN
ncbi:ammonium transporter [Acetobacteraceae bacterium]|nr:ammonium transporter [Acetobacteraceae bacterium]